MASSMAEADAFAAAALRLRSQMIEQIRRLLLRLDTGEGESNLQNTDLALATASRVLQQLDLVLDSEGIAALGTAADVAAVQAAESVREQSEEELGDFRAEMSQQIRELLDGTDDEVFALFEGARREIAEAVRLGVTTGADLGEVIDEVSRVSEITHAQASTAVETAIAGIGRLGTVGGAEQAEEASGEPWVMVFVGPDDGKNRPFCAAFVGKAVLLQDLDLLDNGQGLPARISGGGYNCRHQWIALPLVEAQEDGIEIVQPSSIPSE